MPRAHSDLLGDNPSHAATRLHRIALTTLSVEAPGFYQKQGYDIAVTIDCDPPGLTHYYMMKRLTPPRG